MTDKQPCFPYQRINVVGTSGSGKTLFCKVLSDILGIDHIEIDVVFWGSNWTMPSDAQFLPKLKKELESRRAWVLDGNYTRTIPIKWDKVQLIVWLDYSFIRTLFQALKRAIRRSFSKQEIWSGTGNRETFKKSFFSKNSIILWTIKTHRKVRCKYEKLMNHPFKKDIDFIRLRSPAESHLFLQRINDGS